MSQRFFEDVEVGEALEQAERLPQARTSLALLRERALPVFRDAEGGRELGLEGALVAGPVKISWLMQYADHWAGPEGQLLGLRVAFRRPDVAGRRLMLAGRVTDKREEGGRQVVDLELATIAEDGQASTRAAATVVLPTRTVRTQQE